MPKLGETAYIARSTKAAGVFLTFPKGAAFGMEAYQELLVIEIR